ncbi:MAG: hypothetical protein QOD67_3765 [Caballeronia sp.]|nr:hypothetical protein [Caballeronia sp.]
MRTSIGLAKACPSCSVSGFKTRCGRLSVPFAQVTILILVNCIAQKARATDLGSSQAGYILTPAGNPYNVIAGADIDTTSSGSVALDGDVHNSATWGLTNNGAVTGGYFAVKFDSPVVIVNNGSLNSRSTTAVALYGGGNVTNSSGALIAGRFDGVYADNASSSVTNAGNIGGSASDVTQTQSGVHLPSGGTVTNLASGKIAAYGPGILANSATTIQNAGLITSLNGAAIDLTLGATGIGSVVSNSGTISGQGGTAILFGPEDNTLILTGTSAITGIVDASAHGVSTTNTLILGGAGSGTFDMSSLAATGQYRGFDILQKTDPGVWTFTGTNSTAQTWLVSGGGVEMAGRMSGSLMAAPAATGIDIAVLSGGAIFASSGSAVSVNDSSRVVNSGSISSSADNIAAVVANGAGTSVVNAGSIAATGRNAAAVTINAPTGAASLTNAKGGSITSAGGIAVQAGSNVSIINSGSIAAGGANGAGVAIDALAGSASLTNEQGGSIASAGGAAVQAGSNVSIYNAGTLIGNGAAVRFTGSGNRLTLDSLSQESGDLDGGTGSANALVIRGSGTLSSRAYGFSTLAMQGIDWTVSSSVQIASSSAIESGTLRLTGTLTSPVISVAPGATLTGTGTLNGALTLQGVIAPGVTSSAATSGLQPLAIGTLSVAGSYTQTAGSRYEANVSLQGIDLISVDGTATLQGGTVQARLRAGSFTPADTYKIISTTLGISGTFSGITTFNPFVLPTLIYDANNAYIHVQRGFEFAGGTPNQIAVEAALDHGVAGIGAGAKGDEGALPTRDFLSVAGDLLNLEGSSAYAALDQLGAEAYAAFWNAHFESARLGMDAIDSRLAVARTTGACAAGEATALSASGARACSWISVLGSTGRTGGYDTWLGQQTDLAGVIAGVDYRIAPQLTLGAALVAVHGNTSTDTLPVHGQFDSYQASLYGSYVPGAYWLQATIGYARNDDDMKRSLFFTDTPRTAIGNVDGNQYFASLRNGVDLPIAKFGVFTPFVALEMQSVESQGFTETGADSVNLAVSGNTANSMRSLLGAQWRKDVDWLGRGWNLKGQLAWAHQYGTQTQSINARFEGAADSAFTVHGSGPARDRAQVGLAARVELGRQIHAFLRYDGESGGGGHTHAGSAGIDYRW